MLPVPVGLVGFGLAGRAFHAPVISSVEGLRLFAVVERHSDLSSKLYPGITIFRDALELFRSGLVRLVVIATPNDTHYSLTREALLHDLHVVVDKPFTLTSGEALELALLAGQRNRLLTVYHNRRWDGDFLTVAKLLQDQTLGRVVCFESYFDRYRPQRRSSWKESPRPGAGLLYDIAPHLVDHALMLFGAPDSISADIRIERDDAVVDDAFDLFLEYPHLRVHLGAAMLRCQPRPRFAVHGSLGSYVKHGFDPQEELLRKGDRPSHPGWAQEPESRWGLLITRSETGSLWETRLPTMPGDYRKFYENVRDSLLGLASLLVTPLDACKVIRVLELARKSSATGRVIPSKGELELSLSTTPSPPLAI